MENKILISAENVFYDYITDAEAVHALRGVTCTFEEGKLYAITGRSGSGKSTFLSLLAGFDTVKSGKITAFGEDITKIDREKYRRQNLGIIFQSYYLVPHLTVYENIRLSMEITKHPCKDYLNHISALLEKVSLTQNYLKKRVTHLSGGEQQRVAIARAISSDSKIILADEPTGNLDNENSKNIIEILKSLAHEEGKCVIVVTHADEVASEADIHFHLSDGAIAG